jgi:nucleoside-diphosphate kinase
MSDVQRTLFIVKPDAVAAGVAGKILSRVEENGFTIVGMNMLRLKPDEARGFYYVHAEKPFMDSLVEFMTSGRVVACALERENAIAKLREIVGATDPAEAAEGTIRKDFATDKEKNAVHASDAPETAEWEVGFFTENGLLYIPGD